MSDAPKPKKKGGMGKILMMAGGAIVLLGGGTAGGFYAASMVAPPAAEAHAAPAPPATKYIEIEKGFTSNLAEPDRYIEISLGVSTKTAEETTAAIKTHDPALRSTILGILAEQSADGVSTLAGKQALQAKLKTAMNDTLKSKTGKAGIDDVYFTSFIVQ